MAGNAPTISQVIKKKKKLTSYLRKGQNQWFVQPGACQLSALTATSKVTLNA